MTNTQRYKSQLSKKRNALGLLISTFSFLTVTMLFLTTEPARACGNNAPEKLEQRRKAHFELWDVNDNNEFELEEFLASGEYLDLKAEPSAANWVRLYRDKLALIEPFKNADSDNSGTLSYKEYSILRPVESYMTKGGC